MKERPILFSAPMVRAILEGRKTQTRRIIKLPHNNPLGVWEPTTIGGPNGGRTVFGETVPLQGAIWHTRTGDCLINLTGEPGDRLWVRETTRQRWLPNILTGEPTNALCAEYVADGEPVLDPVGFDLAWWYSKATCPAIHMPRWASRITLEITDVRVERLNDISEEDAIAEGIGSRKIVAGGDARCGMHRVFGLAEDDHAFAVDARQAFEHIWQTINGAGSWDANPWVWVIEFKRLARTTDTGGEA